MGQWGAFLHFLVDMVHFGKGGGGAGPPPPLPPPLKQRPGKGVSGLHSEPALCCGGLPCRIPWRPLSSAACAWRTPFGALVDGGGVSRRGCGVWRGTCRPPPGPPIASLGVGVPPGHRGCRGVGGVRPEGGGGGWCAAGGLARRPLFVTRVRGGGGGADEGAVQGTCRRGPGGGAEVAGRCHATGDH